MPPISLSRWLRQIRSSVSGWFRHISSTLARVPSLGYGATYLFLIPIFALIYSSIPDHFYHTTAKYEQTTAEEVQGILADLRTAMIKQFKKKNPTGVATNLGFQFDIDSTRTAYLEVHEDQVSVVYLLKLQWDDDPQELWFPTDVIFTLNMYMQMTPPNGEETCFHLISSCRKIQIVS